SRRRSTPPAFPALLSPKECSSLVSSTTLAEGVLLPRFQHYSRRRSTPPAFPALLSPKECSSRVSSTTLAGGVLLPRFQHYSRQRQCCPRYPRTSSRCAPYGSIEPGVLLRSTPGYLPYSPIGLRVCHAEGVQVE